MHGLLLIGFIGSSVITTFKFVLGASYAISY